MHVARASERGEAASPRAVRPRADRVRLTLIGVAMAYAGAACLAFAGAGLLHTLPPEFGHTLAILSSAAIGVLLLGTGLFYVDAGGKAWEVVAEQEGLVVRPWRFPWESYRIPWDTIGSLGLRRWDMSPWLGRPRFFVLTLSVIGGVQGQRWLVHVEQQAELESWLEELCGDRFVAGSA